MSSTALVINPHRQIVDRLRALGVATPVIGFPRGAGALVESYAAEAGVAGASGSTSRRRLALGQRLQRRLTIQGALDPRLLLAGGPALAQRVDALLDAWGGGPYVFNLGHGVLPETPIAHIEAVVRRVTGEP